MDDSINNGSNILISNGTRTADFGIAQNQGDLKTIHGLSLLISYELKPHLYWDINAIYRSESTVSDTGEIDSNFIGTGLRYNIAKASVDY